MLTRVGAAHSDDEPIDDVWVNRAFNVIALAVALCLVYLYVALGSAS